MKTPSINSRRLFFSGGFIQRGIANRKNLSESDSRQTETFGSPFASRVAAVLIHFNVQFRCRTKLRRNHVGHGHRVKQRRRRPFRFVIEQCQRIGKRRALLEQQIALQFIEFQKSLNPAAS